MAENIEKGTELKSKEQVAIDNFDPYQIIKWVPPEGGDGPQYGSM